MGHRSRAAAEHWPALRPCALLECPLFCRPSRPRLHADEKNIDSEPFYPAAYPLDNLIAGPPRKLAAEPPMQRAAAAPAPDPSAASAHALDLLELSPPLPGS